MIAMALLFTPDLVIMDEPTSALDVVAQRSLMVQIKELQEQLGFAVIFVTHDMSLVSHFSDRLLVMYAGQVVGDRRRPGQVFDRPRTRTRRACSTRSRRSAGRGCRSTGIPGAPPDLPPPAGRLPVRSRAAHVVRADCCIETEAATRGGRPAASSAASSDTWPEPQASTNRPARPAAPHRGRG